MVFLNRISNSKSDVIEQCLLKFYYRYVKHFTGDPPRNQEELNFGTFVHRVFELASEANDIQQLREVSENLKKDTKLPKRFNVDLDKCLANFIKFNEMISKGETVATELHDILPLDEEHDINYEFIIDRVIKGEDGGYLVVDYKTSKREKNKFELFQDKQLKGYAYAVHKLYKVPVTKITCAHYYPKTHNFVPIKFSSADIHQWKTKEILRVWNIRKKTAEQLKIPMENTFCDWCQFISMCPKKTDPAEVCKRVLLEEQILEEKTNK